MLGKGYIECSGGSGSRERIPVWHGRKVGDLGIVSSEFGGDSKCVRRGSSQRLNQRHGEVRKRAAFLCILSNRNCFNIPPLLKEKEWFSIAPRSAMKSAVGVVIIT